MSDAKNLRAPLDGIRVLDLTMFLAGPYCTRLLADLGAEIIKVEPESGDFLRRTPPRQNGASRYFGQINCGKKSITLDLKSAEGRAAFCRLAADADVLIENYRPGVMRRLKLGYEEIARINPDIIYCSVSGYGQSGAAAERAAFAPIVHAACGFDMVQFDYMQGALERPMRNRNATADVLAATHAFGAIATALFQRERSGEGQRIDVTLIDCMFNLMASEVQLARAESTDRPLIFAPIRAADGFIMVAPVSQANFEALARALGDPEWSREPRFVDPLARIRHFDDLMAEVELWSLARPAVDCERLIREAGCPCTRYLGVAEAFAERHADRPDTAVEIHDAGGTYLIPNSPFRFSNAAVGAKPQVPDLGEHNDEILNKT